MVSFILNCICTIFIPIHPPHRAPTLEEQCRAVKRETGRPDHFQFCAALHTRVWTGFGIVSNETNNTKIYRGMGMRGFTCSSLSIQNWNVRGFVRSSLSQIWNVHALVDDARPRTSARGLVMVFASRHERIACLIYVMASVFVFEQANSQRDMANTTLQDERGDLYAMWHPTCVLNYWFVPILVLIAAHQSWRMLLLHGGRPRSEK
jgi:hypothetical protein